MPLADVNVLGIKNVPRYEEPIVGMQILGLGMLFFGPEIP